MQSRMEKYPGINSYQDYAKKRKLLGKVPVQKNLQFRFFYLQLRKHGITRLSLAVAASVILLKSRFIASAAVLNEACISSGYSFLVHYVLPFILCNSFQDLTCK